MGIRSYAVEFRAESESFRLAWHAQTPNAYVNILGEILGEELAIVMRLCVSHITSNVTGVRDIYSREYKTYRLSDCGVTF